MTGIDSLPQERAAEALREGGLRSYKDQLAFGAHVLVMMGTFYAVGHVAGGAWRPLPAYVRACPFALCQQDVSASAMESAGQGRHRCVRLEGTTQLSSQLGRQKLGRSAGDALHRGNTPMPDPEVALRCCRRERPAG